MNTNSENRKSLKPWHINFAPRVGRQLTIIINMFVYDSQYAMSPDMQLVTGFLVTTSDLKSILTSSKINFLGMYVAGFSVTN